MKTNSRPGRDVIKNSWHTLADFEKRVITITPIGDWVGHTAADIQCPCRPVVHTFYGRGGYWVEITHNAKDGRL